MATHLLSGLPLAQKLFFNQRRPIGRFASVSLYPCCQRMAANACSHNRSGLRSPALASSMILMAMACLTPSSQSPVRKAMQVISRRR
jgi:hypothetical protein